MEEQTLSLESGGDRLHAVLYSASTSRSRGCVVFCHPIFEEQKAACRSLVETAREFSRLGFACLRFDYAGCGDSPGDLDDINLAVWQKNIDSAIALARERADGPVGLLGLRFGGTLAALVAEKN